MDADAIVVGAGLAGLAAAAELADAGRRVIILDQEPESSLGGQAFWSFGGLFFVDSPEQRRLRIRDSRELEEELGIVVKEACLAPLTFASHTYPDFHLLMPLYVCRRWDGMVTAREGQGLAWVRPNRLREYPMPPADVPLVAHLTTLL